MDPDIVAAYVVVVGVGAVVIVVNCYSGLEKMRSDLEIHSASFYLSLYSRVAATAAVGRWLLVVLLVVGHWPLAPARCAHLKPLTAFDL